MKYDQTQKGGWGWICIVTVVEGLYSGNMADCSLDAQMHIMHFYFVCLGAWSVFLLLPLQLPLPLALPLPL